MSYPGNKGKFKPYACSANTSLTASLIDSYGLFVATTAGIRLQLPDPVSGYWGREVEVVNATTGYVSIPTATGAGYSDGGGCVYLAPGESTRLLCGLKSGTTTYAWYRKDDLGGAKWQSYTPTEAWTTATPTTTTVARYRYHSDIVEFAIYCTATDGAGATNATFTPPIIPSDIDAYVPVEAWIKVGTGAPVNCLGAVDCLNNTATSRLIYMNNPQTCTDDSAFVLCIRGWYPVDNMASHTPTLAWTTATPTVSSTVAKHRIVDGKCFGLLYTICSDGKGGTQVTYTPPIFPSDNNVYVQANGFAVVDGVYSNPMPYVDALNNTATSRLITGGWNFPAFTNAKACSLAIAYQFEIVDGYSYTTSSTWTGTAPATWAPVLRYQVHDHKTMSFEFYGTSADGNSASAYEFTLPLPAKYSSQKIALNGYQLVNSSKYDPAAYIDCTSTTAGTRAKVQFANLQAASDGNAYTLCVAGKVELG